MATEPAHHVPLLFAMGISLAVAVLTYGYKPYVEPMRKAKADQIVAATKLYTDRVVNAVYPPRLISAPNVTEDAKAVAVVSIRKPVKAPTETHRRERHSAVRVNRHHKRARYAQR